MATIEQSDSGIKHNPYFLEEAEGTNSDTDLTTDAGKIDENYDNMNITIMEEGENL